MDAMKKWSSKFVSKSKAKGDFMEEQALRVEENRLEVKIISKQLQKYEKISRATIEEGCAFADILIEIGAKARDRDPSEPLGDCMLRMGRFERKMEETRNSLLNTLSEKVQKPLESFIVELDEAKKSKKALDKIYNDYQEATKKVEMLQKKGKDASKLMEAQQEEDQHSEHYKQVGQQTLAQLTMVNSKYQLQMMQRLLDICDAYNSFFVAGMGKIEDIKSVIETLKKQIALKEGEYESMKLKTPSFSSVVRDSIPSLIVTEELNSLEGKEDEAKEKQEDIRVFLLTDLLKSEKEYFQGLDIVINDYLLPLKKEEKLLSRIQEEDPIKLFSNIEAIHAAHAPILPALEGAIDSWPDLAISSIFLPRISSLAIYNRYNRQLTSSLFILAQCRKYSKQFEAFLKSCEERSGRPDVDLGILLKSPSKRIFQYKVFFKKYLQVIGDNDPEKAEIAEVFEKINHLNEIVKRAANIADRYATLCSLKGRIQGYEQNLIEPHRRLLREGTLYTITPDKKKEDCYVILFSDMLINCKPASKEKKHKLKFVSKIKIKGSCENSLDDLPDNDSFKYAFFLTAEGNKFVFAANSQTEKTDWMRELRTAIANADSFRTFGIPLRDLMKKDEQKFSVVPSIVEKATTYILENGLKSEGIFRMSGSSADIEIFSRLYDNEFQSILMEKMFIS
eukprot:TRINITY_DN5167_c0_g1_i1.p1 TRINITY_DN5167_c0_g1~~TRINITY_DN5167_c0_g1_i1.p1  ORF type:complete len:678 (-),score=172.54 TRINITY_DN5167_c0_g1_i1:677-2710(-)